MQLTINSPKIWMHHKAVDFRKSIDGLCDLVQSEFCGNFNEAIFIFHNRHRDKIKILAWHGNGFVLLYKRLEKGKFAALSSDESYGLSSKQLSWLLAGLDWINMSHWKELKFEEYC